MPIPITQEIRKPLLEVFKDEAPHSFAVNDFLDILAREFGEDPDEMSSSDKNVFKQRINEAKNDLRKHELLYNPSKNVYMITRAGLEVLEDNPEIIDDNYFAHPQNNNNIIPQEEAFTPEPLAAEIEDVITEEPPEIPETSEIPEEAPEIPEAPVVEEMPAEIPESIPDTESTTENIEEVLAKFNADLADEVLAKVAALPSDMFEMLVVDLLSKMGYRAFLNARYTSETSGSEFIHGIILEDKMGLSPIYIQARKLSPGRTIGRAEIQDFVEALSDKGGKGLFATTANFSEQAAIYAHDERIMLIDGTRLAGLMITNNFCVNVEKVFELKAIDLDSFSEYER